LKGKKEKLPNRTDLAVYQYIRDFFLIKICITLNSVEEQGDYKETARSDLAC